MPRGCQCPPDGAYYCARCQALMARASIAGAAFAKAHRMAQEPVQRYNGSIHTAVLATASRAAKGVMAQAHRSTGRLRGTPRLRSRS